jgi:hypothetical protein
MTYNCQRKGWLLDPTRTDEHIGSVRTTRILSILEAAQIEPPEARAIAEEPLPFQVCLLRSPLMSPFGLPAAGYPDRPRRSRVPVSAFQFPLFLLSNLVAVAAAVAEHFDGDD